MHSLPQSFFSSDFFSGNRRRLRELVGGNAPIVIAANGLLQRGADSSYAFCQEANFWYLTGIDDPDLILFIDTDREYLLVPPREASRATFDGTIDDQKLTKRSGIATILETEDGWRNLAKRLKKTKQVATLVAAPAYIEHSGIYSNPARARLIGQIQSVHKDIEITDLRSHLANMRMIKQAPELAAMQAAIDITLASIKAATTKTKLAKYEHEYQLEAAIAQGFRSRGASGHSFEPIVAGGDRACTLHNVSNNHALKSGELVVVDVGAEVEHYAADITRTFAIGKPSRRARAVHAAVGDVQGYAFSILKPGVIIGDYEQLVENYMGEKLRTLGLIKTIDHDSVRAYFPHSTSHFLGLNVHDIGDYSRPLEPGMVITVEPGIYISEESIGVRIEDDVLVTLHGIKILSKRLPSSLLY